jgi:hypothetical protein
MAFATDAVMPVTSSPRLSCASCCGAGDAQRVGVHARAWPDGTKEMAALLGLLTLIAALVLVVCSSIDSTTPTNTSLPSVAPCSSVQMASVNVVNQAQRSPVDISTSSALGSGVVFDAWRG